MKKRTLLPAIFMIVAICVVSGCKTHTAKTNTLDGTNIDFNVYGNDNEAYIDFTGSENVSNQEFIEIYYQMLPDALKTKLEQDKWTIKIVSDKELEEMFPNSDMNNRTFNAVTKKKKKKILFPDDRKNIQDSFFHEIGHALDTVSSDLSNTEEFKDIKDEESSVFRETYHYKGAYYTAVNKEFFAELFSQYIISGENLKNNCPNAFQFMEKAVQDI